MTNFDFLKKEPQFDSFADVAISAEKLLHIDMEACVFNCCRDMEFAIKWMYSVDGSHVMPYQDTLASLMETEEFRNLIDNTDLWNRMKLIRVRGNEVAHRGQKISYDVACLCLQNLYYFLDFVTCCYSKHYEYKPYNRDLLRKNSEISVHSLPEYQEIDLKALIAENQALKEQLTARREEQKQTYVP